MPLTDLLTPEAILPSLRANTKKAVLLGMSERAGLVSGIAARTVFDAVLQRERLGSTGVGKGVAIPHGKLPDCERLFGVFARLERPVDFDSIDGEPVDLAFMLVAPEGAGAEHLKALARIARRLREPSVIARLRAARDPGIMLAIFDDGSTSHAA